MRRSLVLAALFVSAAAAVQANEGVELSNKARTSAASGAVTMKSDAPFRSGHDPMPELLLRAELESRGGPSGACDVNASALCYDMADRRVVYRPARRYMPKFDGLQAESVSLRRDRIVFKYSFK